MVTSEVTFEAPTIFEDQPLRVFALVAGIGTLTVRHSGRELAPSPIYAAISTVPGGPWEAGRSFGLNRTQRLGARLPGSEQKLLRTTDWMGFAQGEWP